MISAIKCNTCVIVNGLRTASSKLKLLKEVLVVSTTVGSSRHRWVVRNEYSCGEASLNYSLNTDNLVHV